MKLNKVYETTFNTSETIISATLSKSTEVVMLMSSGSVIRFNLDNQHGTHLFSVKSNTGYSDDGFDLSSKSSIYTMDEIVVVVNDFKRHGFVHYPGNYPALHLWREDYHADISSYPIALYKDINHVPHLIYGEAWNHIQIMNLDSRQVLTAAKSLIEEGAEEKHIQFYKTHREDNKLAWPSRYDYFFGKLFISPNQKKFLSAGWIWGSNDCYNVYDIDKFITSNRISDVVIGAWEHENRATCWVDNETIAVAYSPFTEGDENSTADSPCEIHLHRISGDKVTIDRKIKTDYKKLLSSRMLFNRSTNSFICISDEGNLSVLSLEGEIIFQDDSTKVNEYSIEMGRFLVTDDKSISVYELH